MIAVFIMVFYTDRHKILCDLLICNKKTPLFCKKRGICQPIHIPSSMVIRDGTFSTAFHMVGLLS